MWRNKVFALIFVLLGAATILMGGNAAFFRFYKLLRTIFSLCELAGFDIQGRIVLVDRKTGRVWR